MRKLSCGKDLQSRTSQLGSDTFEYESHTNIPVLNLFACPVLVHVVQSACYYGTAPVDPCRPQNRGSHDYLRAHKGSRRMSRPLVQDSSVNVLFPRCKGNLT